MQTKNRNIGFDLLKIILCLFVITIHCRPYDFYARHKTLEALLLTVCFLCNPCFYMINGFYSLSSSYENRFRTYYVKKFITIIIPYLIYCVFYIIDSVLSEGGRLLSFKTIKIFIVKVFTNTVSPHFWFIYILIGIIIAVPFLGFCFNKMKESHIFFLFGMALILLQGKVLLSNFDINDPVNFFFTGYLYIYCLGWFSQKINRKTEKWIFLGGFIGFICNVLAKSMLPRYDYSYDFVLTHIIFCFAVFIFFRDHVHITNEKLSKAVSWLSGFTYSVYLIHWFVMEKCTEHFQFLLQIRKQLYFHFVKAILIFIISFGIAIVVDTLFIKPITRKLKEKFVNDLKPVSSQ